MADSTLPPPPPPAPGQGAADAPLPTVDAAPAKPAARKPAAAKPAAAKPAARKPAAAKPAAAKPAAAPPAAVEPVPVVAPAGVAAERPNPYAPVATAPATPAASAGNPYNAIPVGPSSTLSVLALVFGILGLVMSLFSFGFLPALAGVILGHIALKREPRARGMAIAGLSTGYAGIGLSVLIGIAILAITVLPLILIGTAGGFGG